MFESFRVTKGNILKDLRSPTISDYRLKIPFEIMRCQPLSHPLISDKKAQVRKSLLYRSGAGFISADTEYLLFMIHPDFVEYVVNYKPTNVSFEF